MKNLSINLLKLCLVWAITVFLVASCTKPSYANSVHPHGELALVGYNSIGVQTASRGFFVRQISMHLHFMARLERDTFTCVGILLSLSTNPFQFCHPHFNELGETSIQSIGVHHHA